MSVVNRIILMLLSALLALVLSSAYGLWGISTAQNRFDFMQDNATASEQVLGDMRLDVEHIRVAVRDALLAETPQERDQWLKQSDDIAASLEKKLGQYEKDLISDETDRKMLQSDRELLTAYMGTAHQLAQLLLAGDKEAIHKMRAEGGPFRSAAGKLSTALKDHTQYNIDLGEKLQAANAAATSQSRWVQSLIMLLALAFVGTQGYRLCSQIRKRLGLLRSMMENINQTLDFTQRFKITRMDELGSTANAFNGLVDRLQGNLKSIAQSTQAVADSAAQMTSTSTQVAQAAQQQSEAASGMASTVEELTVSINHVGDRAQEANQLSSHSGDLASKGEQVIAQTVQGINQIAGTVHKASERIHELEHHSTQIASVIAVIKEVADQTNLLALNAAIEAARAGEQGRGFAVVADEVRKLAERTASSTQEIGRTIEAMRQSASASVQSMQDAVDEVNRGVASAQQASDSIHEIGNGSHQAVGMVNEITSAIREQGAATNNIAVQVEKIAQMSEESSAAAKEGAHSAQELDRLASEMRSIVAAYRL